MSRREKKMNKGSLVITILSVMLVVAVAIIIFLLTKNTNAVYTISFNTNGGNKVLSQKVEEGNKVTKPANPLKEGYEFLGWYLNGAYFDFQAEVKGNLTLDAKWKEIVVEDKNDEEDKVTKYTVTFNSDGGSKISKQTVEEGKKATEPKAPTKSGYTFKGWYLGSTKYNFSNKVTNDITLTAKWEKVEEKPTVTKYTVTFNANGGTSVAKQTIEEGKTATSKKTTRTGYTFLGWYLNGEKFDFSTPIKSNITLKAEWKKDDVITYKIEDTNSVLNQQKLYILKNGKAVAGTVDIVNTSGKTVKRSVPETGTTIVKGTYTKITNIKVD